MDEEHDSKRLRQPLHDPPYKPRARYEEPTTTRSTSPPFFRTIVRW